MADVISLGEPLVVLLPAEAFDLEAADSLIVGSGGAEANSATLLSRLGHTVKYVSRVGDDPFGRRIMRHLAAAGLDVRAVKVESDGRTGFYFRERLISGPRSVHYHRHNSAASRLNPEDLDAADFTGARVLLISGITPALSPSCAATVHRAIGLARASGASVALDPNYRLNLWDLPTARKTLLPLIAEADILLMSDEDAEAILDATGASAMIAAAKLGAKTVVLKSGDAGSAALVDGSVVQSARVPASRVIDAVGAGDAFNAGFLAAWLRGLAIEEALGIGNELGAAAVAEVGDNTISNKVIERIRRHLAGL